MGRIKQFIDVNATKEQIYDMWLNSKKHSKLIGATAVTSNKVGGKISIWDGYITGKNLELIQDYKIVQLLRFDYDDWDEDHFSKFTLKFKRKSSGKIQIVINHSQIPKAYTKEISDGWKKYYWDKLKLYKFS